jgi:predicted transposase YbfD/YdcC
LEGDYVIGLKGNQETLFEEVKRYIEDCIADEHIEMETAQTIEKSRDRIERRTCMIAPDLDWLANKKDWKGLESAFAILRETTTKGEKTAEMSFYISSLKASPERFLKLMREHWGVESMHWILDVVFSEDESRILNTNGQKSMNIFRKLAIALHKNFISGLPQKTKPSLKKNMLKALISDSLLLNVVSNSM